LIFSDITKINDYQFKASLTYDAINYSLVRNIDAGALETINTTGLNSSSNEGHGIISFSQTNFNNGYVGGSMSQQKIIWTITELPESITEPSDVELFVNLELEHPNHTYTPSSMLGTIGNSKYHLNIDANYVDISASKATINNNKIITTKDIYFKHEKQSIMDSSININPNKVYVISFNYTDTNNESFNYYLSQMGGDDLLVAVRAVYSEFYFPQRYQLGDRPNHGFSTIGEGGRRIFTITETAPNSNKYYIKVFETGLKYYSFSTLPLSFEDITKINDYQFKAKIYYDVGDGSPYFMVQLYQSGGVYTSTGLNGNTIDAHANIILAPPDTNQGYVGGSISQDKIEWTITELPENIRDPLDVELFVNLMHPYNKRLKYEYISQSKEIQYGVELAMEKAYNFGTESSTSDNYIPNITIGDKSRNTTINGILTVDALHITGDVTMDSGGLILSVGSKKYDSNMYYTPVPGSKAEMNVDNLRFKNYSGNWLNGYWYYSDDRLKKSEQSLINTTDILMKLKPVKYELYSENDNKNIIDASGRIISDISYSFVNNLSTKTTNQFGLIAQEIYTIPELRDLVVVPSDSDISGIINTTIYDGATLDEPAGFYESQGWGVKEPAGINYSGFIPLLIKSFQEQQAVITQQQTIINNLLQQLNNSNTYDDFKNNMSSVDISGN